MRFTVEYDLGSLRDHALRVLPVFLSLAAADFQQRGLFDVIDRLFEEQERRRSGTPRASCKSITFNVEPRDCFEVWGALQCVARGFEASYGIAEQTRSEKVADAKQCLDFCAALSRLVEVQVEEPLREAIWFGQAVN